MVEHKFEYKGGDSEGTHWKVICPKTKGNFYVSLWRKGKVKDQICACCGGYVRGRK